MNCLFYLQSDLYLLGQQGFFFVSQLGLYCYNCYFCFLGLVCFEISEIGCHSPYFLNFPTMNTITLKTYMYNGIYMQQIFLSIFMKGFFGMILFYYLRSNLKKILQLLLTVHNLIFSESFLWFQAYIVVVNYYLVCATVVRTFVLQHN